MKNVKSADDKVLADYEETVTAVDVAAPTVSDIKVTAPNTIRVQFSEPLDQVPTFSLNNGNTAIVATAFAQGNDYADLTIGITPENGSTHTLNVKDGKDYAGFKVANVDKTFTYTADIVAPTATVEILSASKVKVKFDKAVKNVTDGNVSFYHTAKSVEYKLLNSSVSGDNKEVTFDLKLGQVLPEGEVKILVAYTNENGTKIEDTFGNKFAETTLTATYTADKTAPTITNVVAHSTTALDVTFDEAVQNAGTAANYTLKDSSGAVVNVTAAVQQGTTNTYRLTTAQLDGGNYTLAVKNVTDLSGNKLSDAPINVAIEDKVAPTVTLAGEVVTAKKVRINFSEAMDKASIEDKANYGVNNGVLPTAVKITAAPDNKSVVLDFTDVTGADAKDFTATPGSTTINVGRVKDAAGNPTTNLSTAVTVAHTATLATVAPKKQEAVSTKQVKLYFDEVITNARTSDFVVKQDVTKTIGGISNDIVDGKSVITLTLADGQELDPNTGSTTGVAPATAATVETAATGVTAENSVGSKVKFNAANLADKIAPAVAKTVNPAVDNIVINDANTNGIVDEIDITFTENLKAGTVSIEDFIVDGYTVTDTSVANNVVTLAIKEGTTANMADTFTVKFVGDMSDINDNVLVANPSKEYKSIALVVPAAPTVTGGAGQINSTTTAMEYRAVGGTTWTQATATNTTVAAGDYEVRTAATSTTLASAITTVTVTAAPAPALAGVTLTDALGVANDGKSVANLPAAGAGNTFKYLISSDNSAVPTPVEGFDASAWTTVANKDLITVANGKNVGIAEVDSDNKVVKFVNVVASNVNATPAVKATATSEPISSFDFSGVGANKTFTISDGTNIATVNLTTDVTDIDGLVQAINTAIGNAAPGALDVKAAAEGTDKVKLTAGNATITITISGTNANDFFTASQYAPTPEQN